MVAVIVEVRGRPYRIASVGLAPQVVAAIVVLAAFATTIGYIRHSRKISTPWPNYTARVEYRITDWLWKNMPDARVDPRARFASGSTPGTTSRNWEADPNKASSIPLPSDSQWEITGGSDPQPAILWLQAMGVDVMYVPGPNSEEPYKDIQHPERFAGATPLLYDDGQGNALYRIPRRYPARARVVEAARLDARRPPRTTYDKEYLRAYVDVVENGPDSPVTLERQGTDAMLLRARLSPGQAILVQETYDPAWQAWSNGKRLPLHADAMGFMVVEAPPGEHQVRLAFVMPFENRVGWVLTGISLLLLAALAQGMRARKPDAVDVGRIDILRFRRWPRKDSGQPPSCMLPHPGSRLMPRQSAHAGRRLRGGAGQHSPRVAAVPGGIHGPDAVYRGGLHQPRPLHPRSFPRPAVVPPLVYRHSLPEHLPAAASFERGRARGGGAHPARPRLPCPHGGALLPGAGGAVLAGPSLVGQPHAGSVRGAGLVAHLALLLF